MAQRRVRTVIRSFRLYEPTLIALEEEANRLGISLNALVNRLLLSFAEYERLARGFGIAKIPLPLLRYLLEELTDEAVIKAGKVAGQEVPEAMIRAREAELTERGALEHLRLMGLYSGLFEYSEALGEGARTITLTHSLGLKGSLLIGHYAQALLEGVGLTPSFSIGEHAVVLELRAEL